MNLQEHLDVVLTFGMFVNYSVEALLERDDVTENEIKDALQKHINAELKAKLTQAIYEKNSLAAIVGKQADEQEVSFQALMAVVLSGAEGADAFQDKCKEIAPIFELIKQKLESGDYKFVHTAKGLNTGRVISEAMKARTETAVIFEQL